MSHERRSIKVDYLARVEGEGRLNVEVTDGRVETVELSIFEPPRYFEAFLRERQYNEAVDITARICGICPVAYQMSACHAMEDALGAQVTGTLRALRRLLYCGEWIESHVLHISMLHAPDFLGCHNVIELAAKDSALVEKALRLKKAGNGIVNLLGGREIHPINVRCGGFYRAPDPAEFDKLKDELRWGRDAACELCRWTGKLEFPDVEHDYLLVSLQHADEYPMNEGQIVSNRGLKINAREYPEHFAEQHIAHSNALQSQCDGETYLVGPLARYHHNYQRLPSIARQAASDAGLSSSCLNPFRSISVRAVEVVFAFDEALRILDQYTGADPAAIDMETRAGTGHAATEAPRGLLYHRYRLNDDGLIAEANIVPPTSQNQAIIESDVTDIVKQHMNDDDDVLRHLCEQSIRNYDPCISCATHFLDLRVKRQ